MSLANEIVENAFNKAKVEDKIQYVARLNPLLSKTLFSISFIFILIVGITIFIELNPFFVSFLLGWLLIFVLVLVIMNIFKDFLEVKDQLIKKYLFKK